MSKAVLEEHQDDCKTNPCESKAESSRVACKVFPSEGSACHRKLVTRFVSSERRAEIRREADEGRLWEGNADPHCRKSFKVGYARFVCSCEESKMAMESVSCQEFH